MKLLFCETPHGKRYHVFTETPESYYEELVWQTPGIFEDPEGALASGYVRPEEWDKNGDLESAVGELLDSYLADIEAEEAQKEYFAEMRSQGCFEFE